MLHCEGPAVLVVEEVHGGGITDGHLHQLAALVIVGVEHTVHGPVLSAQPPMAVIAQGSFQEGGAVLFLLGGGCPTREVVEILRGDVFLESAMESEDSMANN